MKIQIPIRIEEDLLEMARAEAKAQNRSFNNYMESLLYRDLGEIPRKQPQKEKLDTQYDLNLNRVNAFDKWIKSLINDDLESKP